LIVDLPTEGDVAELMYILTWAAGTEPSFTPIVRADVFDKAIKNARKAPKIWLYAETPMNARSRIL